MGTDFDADGSDVYRTIVGAQLDRGLTNRWHLTASVNLYPNVADGAFWLSTDLKFRPPLVTNLIYFGAGATAANGGARRDHYGADIVVGSEPRLPWLFRPFAEAKWVMYQRYTSFTVQGGLELVL